MFTIYLCRGAIHRGKPFSSKSSDPNGTLITGLRADKKPFTKVVLPDYKKSKFFAMLIFLIVECLPRAKLYCSKR